VAQARLREREGAPHLAFEQQIGFGRWIAGQQTSITIAGTGFGTAPTLSATGTGVNLTLNSASPDGTTIQATATVALTAPSESVTITVQPGYAGNGFYCNCQGAPPNGTDTATVQPVTPTPQIMFNGGNIAGTTQSVVAGRQIALSVPTPSGYSIQSQSWVFSNQSAITGGFVNGDGTPGTQPSASAGGSEASDPSLNQNSLTFYWVNPGDNGETVTCTYTLNNGQSASATATFNVGGPSGNLLPSPTIDQPSGSGVTFTTNAKCGLYGVPYGGGSVGITFQANAQPPTTGAGTNAAFTWIQLIKSINVRYINASGVNSNPNSGKTGLDGTYPYFSKTANLTYDSPSIGLQPQLGEVGYQFDATMYLLWDPALPSGCIPAATDPTTYHSTASTCTSIPIPLGSAEWSWTGCAINTLVQQAYPLTWIKQCGVSNLNASQSAGYPTWQITVNPMPQ